MDAEALGDLSRWEAGGHQAILDEAEFIAEVAALRARGEQLRAPLMWRLEELFTDMAEEFVSSNQTELAANIPGWDRQGLYSRVRCSDFAVRSHQSVIVTKRHAAEVREVVSSFTLDQKCEFVLLHADEWPSEREHTAAQTALSAGTCKPQGGKATGLAAGT
ncbi:unnamed protein product [Effrenium voratum]|uniref:Uncharacterized protein n=1 Tax=Effrenium voratum TaxID=2562239 RepID=A0AA36JDN5_9DINO|nr:unnamed protein product [Effrenium voratum]